MFSAIIAKADQIQEINKALKSDAFPSYKRRGQGESLKGKVSEI